MERQVDRVVLGAAAEVCLRARMLVYVLIPLSESWNEPSARSLRILTVCVSLFILQTIEFDESAGAVLRIQPLRTPRDENIYECVAQNPHGEVTVHAKLTVLRGKEHSCLLCQCHRAFRSSFPSDSRTAVTKCLVKAQSPPFFA